MPRKGNSIEVKRRKVGTGNDNKGTDFFCMWDEENVLKLIVVIVIQFCNYTKNIQFQICI